jgi:hypothetical protein
MGSLTDSTQIDLDSVLAERNDRFDVNHQTKAKNRGDIEPHDVHPLADSWWGKAVEK